MELKRKVAQKTHSWVSSYSQESSIFQQVITMQTQAKLSLDLAKAIMERKGAAEGDRERQGRRIKKSY